ncbi:MAG: MBG domain-containing protein, partial [Ginsengibacter sp.]
MRLLLRSFLFTLLAITFSSMNVFSQSATISTDQPDYAPGSTVIISGTGFQPGETVTLQVLHDPTGGDDATSPAHQPWTVVADANGNVSSTWLVPADEDELGATLKLTAVGGSSGLSASVVFTDGVSYANESVGSQAASLVYGTASSTTFVYNIKVNGAGSTTGTINVSGLPAGATYTYPTAPEQGSNTITVTIQTSSSTPAGNYTLTFSTSFDAHPNPSVSDGKSTLLVVGKRVATVTADPQTKTYGDANPTLTATVTGEV